MSFQDFCSFVISFSPLLEIFPLTRNRPCGYIFYIPVPLFFLPPLLSICRFFFLYSVIFPSEPFASIELLVSFSAVHR